MTLIIPLLFIPQVLEGGGGGSVNRAFVGLRWGWDVGNWGASGQEARAQLHPGPAAGRSHVPAPPAASQVPCQFSFPSGELCLCPRCKNCQALEAVTMRWLKRGARPSSADGPGRDNHVSCGASRPVHGSGRSPKPCHQGQSAWSRPRCRFFTAQAPFVSPLLVLPRCGVMVALWMRSVFTLGWSFPLGWC